MINNVTLMGRITHELEMKQTQSGNAFLKFTVACERPYAKPNEERQSDFIRCQAWGKTAEFIQKYFAKGRMIAVIGSLRTSSYQDKSGVKQYITEVLVSEASFTGEKSQNQTQQPQPQAYQQQGYQQQAYQQPYQQQGYQQPYQQPYQQQGY